MRHLIKPAVASALGFTIFLAAAVAVQTVASSAAERAADIARSYLQIFCRQFSLDDSSIPAEIRKKLDASPARDVRDARGTLWRATAQGLLEIDNLSPKSNAEQPESAVRTKLWTGKDGLPIVRPTGIAADSSGGLWIATEDGAIYFASHTDGAHPHRWFYFWGKRYLPDNFVENVSVDENSKGRSDAQVERAWIRTRTGIARIEFQPFDLEQKSALFIERLQHRHNRYGYVADCDLLRPGDTSSYRMTPSDNDGLWTAIYVAAECFRYAVSHSPEALANVRASLAALEQLEATTGIPGFPARALIHRGDYRDPGGEWHWTPDGELEWKGDTSSDELVGHFFAYQVAYDLLPDERDRQSIRPAVERMASHLLGHHLQLVGYGGRVTTWGKYNPEYFETPDGRSDRSLNSLELLSHLRVAYRVTGNQRFLAEYQRIGRELGYFDSVMRMGTDKPIEINYSDEELAFLAWYPLMQLEDDPELCRRYQEALEGFWQRARDEHNPLWNFVYAASTGAKDYARADAVDTLERVPLDTVSWTVKNSQRADLELAPAGGRFGEKQARRAIPPNEHCVMKWNGNPFELDCGSAGRSEDDGAFFLLPYWMGRFHRLIP
ncbi:MAG TPA: hypothetical protein VG204_15820 [Terriglobia bacterium]|nr:hypothetical protein [Terriglobia bacterium]